MQVTLSVVKADIGSIGGHTRPSGEMLQRARDRVASEIGELLLDGVVTHTGDDVALTMSHTRGTNAVEIHQLGWSIFQELTAIAEESGLYGAGQDLIVDAPSGNIRGAGPAVAEIEFERSAESPDRPVESFVVITADKCGPGAYNYPLYSVFCDPMRNGALLLSTKIREGFVFDIVDMDAKDNDRRISLEVPERNWDIAALLQNSDRFAVETVRSRYKPAEVVASVSATRLHNIAGKYVGKDDPVAIVRTQGIFPAPEEVVEPYLIGPFVSGGSRGSHIMPIMPVAANSTVAGVFTLPLVSCVGYSMDSKGHFSKESVDFFADAAWDYTRNEVQRRILEWRRQGFFGPTMASQAELSYSGLVDALKALESEFS